MSPDAACLLGALVVLLIILGFGMMNQGRNGPSKSMSLSSPLLGMKPAASQMPGSKMFKYQDYYGRYESAGYNYPEDNSTYKTPENKYYGSPLYEPAAAQMSAANYVMPELSGGRSTDAVHGGGGNIDNLGGSPDTATSTTGVAGLAHPIKYGMIRNPQLYSSDYPDSYNMVPSMYRAMQSTGNGNGTNVPQCPSSSF